MVEKTAITNAVSPDCSLFRHKQTGNQLPRSSEFCENFAPRVKSEEQTFETTDKIPRITDVVVECERKGSRKYLSTMTEVSEDIQMKRRETHMGYVIFYFFLPVLLRACCMENHRRKNPGNLQHHILS